MWYTFIIYSVHYICMSDNFIRHLIAAIASGIAILIYVVGYASGGRGWWWTIIGVIGFYIIVHKLVDA